MGLSREALDRRNAGYKERYRWYKARGICPKCGGENAAPGHVYGADCLKKAKVSMDNAKRCKERRERLKTQGLCVVCGEKAVVGRVMCEKCAARNRRSRERREKGAGEV